MAMPLVAIGGLYPIANLEQKRPMQPVDRAVFGCRRCYVTHLVLRST